VPFPVAGSVRVTGTMVSAPFPPSPPTLPALLVRLVDDDGEDRLCDLLELDPRELESVGVGRLVLLLVTESVELIGNDVGLYDTVAVEIVIVLVMLLALRLTVALEALASPLEPREAEDLPLVDSSTGIEALVEDVPGAGEDVLDESRLLLVTENVTGIGTLSDLDEATVVVPDPGWREVALDVGMLLREVLKVELKPDSELE